MDQYHIRGEDSLKGLADPPCQALFSVPPALIKLGLPFMKRPQPTMVPYKAGHRDPTRRVRSQARQLSPHSHAFSFSISLSLSLSSKSILFLTPHQLTSLQLTAKYSLNSLNPRSHHSIYQHSFLSHSSRKPAAAPGLLARAFFCWGRGRSRPGGSLHVKKPQV